MHRSEKITDGMNRWNWKGLSNKMENIKTWFEWLSLFFSREYRR